MFRQYKSQGGRCHYDFAIPAVYKYQNNDSRAHGCVEISLHYWNFSELKYTELHGISDCQYELKELQLQCYSGVPLDESAQHDLYNVQNALRSVCYVFVVVVVTVVCFRFSYNTKLNWRFLLYWAGRKSGM